nr:hypothetical protein GCM10025699_28990 [Microbacterium flavescens]
MDRDEVRTAHVPVSLLAVDGESLKPEHEGVRNWALAAATVGSAAVAGVVFVLVMSGASIFGRDASIGVRPPVGATLLSTRHSASKTRLR